MHVAIGVLIGLLLGLAVGAALLRRRRDPARPADDAEGGTAEAAALSPAVVDVLDTLQSMTVIVDPDDHVVRASHSAKALGLVRSGELVHPELRTLVRDVRERQQVREMEFEVARGPVGVGRLSIGVRIAPLGTSHVLALIEDHTSSRRVEETRRDFVANVSHELKTPVGGLTLLAEAMDEARDDPESVHRFATRMRTETSRLARLVQEIVELSRLQAADTLESPDLVDVRQCVREAVDHLLVVAEDRQIQIVTDLGESGRPAEIYGDANLVTTAVRNVVENAISYSGSDTTVRVSVQTGTDLVAVQVEDEGAGISPDDLDRIFERFYRVDAARSRSTGGTGLGLAIVKHICANHGGEVSVRSEEGHGSTFIVRLPLARPSGGASSPTTRKVSS
ncbi:sensor histidine kinase [Leekyejoonella antrihumi]|uniref:Sensor-like histidine kinase SenX3 n=1 Tax=Leekyejoonella antrihumi TaxID=1660198 RepID=A0A563E8H2_9MICO|nr:ATP-binding protein [Leekyejoonella antrihumi]TWP38878.1 two-component sensor histidine kinase [Leekyejoonella antrihumi]